MGGGGRVLGKTVRLQAIDVRTEGSEAEVLESKFPGTRADLAAGAGVGASARGVKPPTDVARGPRVLRIKTVARPVKPA